MTTHPHACEERLDAHAFLCRPSNPSQNAAGDLFYRKKAKRLCRADGHKWSGEVAFFHSF